MKTRKRIILLAALTFATIAIHAQHFDWVKSYSGQEPSGKYWNYIVSSVTYSGQPIKVETAYSLPLADYRTSDGAIVLRRERRMSPSPSTMPHPTAWLQRTPRPSTPPCNNSIASINTPW